MTSAWGGTDTTRTNIRCPYCGQRRDQCTGHAAMLDPDGYLTLLAHADGVHRWCHPAGCPLAEETPSQAAERRGRHRREEG